MFVVRSAVIALTSLLVLGSMPADTQARSSSLAPAVARQPAPDFSLADANGAPVSLSAYRGQVVLLDFWATWCTGCKTEIPWYIEFQRKYALQGLTSIGAAMDDEGWQKVRPYLAEHPIPYAIVIGNPDLIQPYAIKNLPVTLLIDRRGRIADAHAGLVEKDAWEQKIRRLLRERI